MNPVAMHEVNKFRHQELKKANETRRRAFVTADVRRSPVKTLLGKLGGIVGRRQEQADATGAADLDGQSSPSGRFWQGKARMKV